MPARALWLRTMGEGRPIVLRGCILRDRSFPPSAYKPESLHLSPFRIFRGLQTRPKRVFSSLYDDHVPELMGRDDAKIQYIDSRFISCHVKGITPRGVD